MTNPYLARLAAKDDFTHGRTSEVRVAKVLQAKLQPGSGNQRGSKGDMILTTAKRKFRLESKATKNLSINLELGWLVKIVHEALSDGSTPGLTISFVDPQGKLRSPGSEYVVLPMRVFRELTE